MRPKLDQRLRRASLRVHSWCTFSSMCICRCEASSAENSGISRGPRRKPAIFEKKRVLFSSHSSRTPFAALGKFKALS